MPAVHTNIMPSLPHSLLQYSTVSIKVTKRWNRKDYPLTKEELNEEETKKKRRRNKEETKKKRRRNEEEMQKKRKRKTEETDPPYIIPCYI